MLTLSVVSRLGALIVSKGAAHAGHLMAEEARPRWPRLNES